jgi:hypothetical protein
MPLRFSLSYSYLLNEGLILKVTRLQLHNEQWAINKKALRIDLKAYLFNPKVYYILFDAVFMAVKIKHPGNCKAEPELSF